MEQFTEQIQNEFNRRYRATVLVSGVQLGVAFILTILAWLIAGKFYPFGLPASNETFSIDSLTNSQNGNVVTTTLWIAILAVAISSFLLRRAIFAPTILRDTAIVKGASGLLKSLQTKTILVASLGELIAILGFIIALMSGQSFDMLRAMIVSIIIFFISFPRQSVWQRVITAAGKY